MSKTNLPVCSSEDALLIKVLSIKIETLFSFEELMENYKNTINVKILDNIDELVKEFSCRKRLKYKSEYIRNLTSELVIEKVSDNDYSIIKNTLDKLFAEKLEIHFLQIHTKILELKNTSKNKNEYDEKVLEFIKNDTKKYIEYLIKKDGIKNYGIKDDMYLILLRSYEYYPFNISNILNEVNYGKNKVKILIPSIKKIMEKSNQIKFNDKLLHNTVENQKDKIINMRNNGMSFGKIQKTLTEECIEQNIIPKTIERYDRKANSKSRIIEVTTLLPISSIKKVISEGLKTKQINDEPYEVIDCMVD